MADKIAFEVQKIIFGVGDFKSLQADVVPAKKLLVSIPCKKEKSSEEGNVVALDSFQEMLTEFHKAFVSIVLCTPSKETSMYAEGVTPVQVLVQSPADDDLSALFGKEESEPEKKSEPPVKEKKSKKVAEPITPVVTQVAPPSIDNEDFNLDDLLK